MFLNFKFQLSDELSKVGWPRVKGQGDADFTFIQFLQPILVNTIYEEHFKGISLNLVQLPKWSQ